MKNILALTFCLCLLLTNTYAQKAVVNPHKEIINEDHVNGYKSTIEGSVEEIINQWTKNLRSMGKYRERGSYAVVTDFSIGDELFEDSTLYATIQSDESTATVWLGSLMTDSASYGLDDFLKGTVYDFTISYHRSVVQKQIDEAERAVAITTKKHQRLTKDSVELVNKLTSTKNEIIRLEQLVERNELQTKVLDEKLIMNSNARDSVFLEIGKMKAIVEEHKKRKNAIE